jgi:hypothetical protein
VNASLLGFRRETDPQRGDLQSGDHLANVAQHAVGRVGAGDTGIVVPNLVEIGKSFGRPENWSLRSAMLLVLAPNHVLNVRLSALSGIERTDALVDFNTKLTQSLDVRQQLAANLLLIGVRQVGDFGDGLLESLDHNDSVPHSASLCTGASQGEAPIEATSDTETAPPAVGPTRRRIMGYSRNKSNLQTPDTIVSEVERNFRC